MARRRQAVRVAAVVVVAAGLLAAALWPSPVGVDVAAIGRGPLLVTVDEEGETRVRHRFVVSTPVEGEVGRVDLEPGDRVERGRTVIATVRPDPPPLLDARAQAEAESQRTAARAAVQHAQAEQRRAATARDRALRERRRQDDLAAGGLTTPQRLDEAETQARDAEEATHAAMFAVATAVAELERAERRLRPPLARQAPLAIVAPVDGLVLRRLRESGGTVPEGTPLVEIGDPRDLEVVADLLSSDAVAVRPGARVLIEQWGGGRALEGRVRRVAPSGRTKVSALGVEEQRVDVTIDFVGDAARDTGLGDAYRVEVRVVVADRPDVLRVPTGALFRDGDAWAVFAVDGGRARRTPVTLGVMTPAFAEVTAGLAAGAVVVLHPPDTLEDGSRVTHDRGAASK